MGVGQNLNFDMARLNHEFFNKDAVIAKGVAGLVHRRTHPVSHIRRTFDDAHAFTAATGRRLDHHGVADFLCLCHCLVNIADCAICSGNTGYAGGFGKGL